MIELEHVGMGYLPGKEILRDVSMKLQRGAFYFLSGPSGVGKTTLLGVLALHHRASKGRIKMFGHDVTRLPREALPQLRRRIGLVSQDYKLLPHLTVKENVGLPLKICGEPEAEINAKAVEMLDWVGLKDYPNERPDVLSGGQKQRVAIARAVISKPDVLLCDEPSGNLDIQLSLRFMYLFEALNKMGTTVFVATHDDYLISQYRYPVFKLADGKIAA